MVILPHTGGISNESFSQELEGTVYNFNMMWNSLDEAWYLRMGLVGQDYLIKAKVTTGSNLLEPFYHLAVLPQGGLFCEDTLFFDGRPLFDDIGQGKRFELQYITVEDIDGLST